MSAATAITMRAVAADTHVIKSKKMVKMKSAYREKRKGICLQ